MKESIPLIKNDWYYVLDLENLVEKDEDKEE
jgi:hypothetical protein